MAKATLAKVAARAGVSRTQASNALSGSGRVSSEARERVLAAAAELGYRPNRGAQLLSSGTAPLLAVVFDHSTVTVGGSISPWWGRFLVGFTNAATDLDCFVMFEIAEDVTRVMTSPATAIINVSDATVVDSDLADFGRIVGAKWVGGSESGDSRHTVFSGSHDYEQVGRDCADKFRATGCNSILINQRPGEHLYASLIESSLRDRATELGMGTETAVSDATNAQIASLVAGACSAGCDGILNLADQLPATIAGVARTGRSIARDAQDGVVVIDQADGYGETLEAEEVILLVLDADETGRQACEWIVAAVNGRTPEPIVFRHSFE